MVTAESNKSHVVDFEWGRCKDKKKSDCQENLLPEQW